LVGGKSAVAPSGPMVVASWQLAALIVAFKIVLAWFAE
jgi:hypothetical protein